MAAKMTQSNAQCTAQTASGACRMAPLRGSSRCFAHAPQTAQARRAAAAKGGRKGRIGYGAPVDVSTLTALQAHVAQLLGDVLRRPNTERRAATGARLVETGRRLLDDLDLRQRLELLEQRLAAMEELNG